LPRIHEASIVLFDDAREIAEDLSWLKRNNQGQTHTTVSSVLPKLFGEAQCRAKIDATNEPNPGQKGMTGLSSSTNAPTLPIRLSLVFPVVSDAQEKAMLADFTLSNAGQHPVQVPISTDPTRQFSRMLRLVLRSSDGKVRSLSMLWCAELYGQIGDRASFITLNPKETIIVHARCRFPAPSDQVSPAAHAELIDVGNGKSSLVGSVHSSASLFMPRK